MTMRRAFYLAAGAVGLLWIACICEVQGETLDEANPEYKRFRPPAGTNAVKIDGIWYSDIDCRGRLRLIVNDESVFRYTFDSDDLWCVARLDDDDLAIKVLRSCDFDRLCRIRGRVEWSPRRLYWNKIYRAYDLEGAGGAHELFVARPETCAKTAPVPPFNRELAFRLEACRKTGYDTGEVPFPQPRLKDLQVDSKIDWFAIEVDVQRLKWPGASEGPV
jgi:hypothetical protein